MRRAALASSIAIGLALAPLATACTSAAPEVHDFALTAPATAVELLPVAGEALDLTWRYDADAPGAFSVGIEARPTTELLAPGEIAWAALTDGTARYVVPPAGDGVLPLPPPLPPAVYQLVGHVRGATEVATATAPGLLVMQGAYFRARELTFTADVADRDIWMTTVTATVARAVVSLTPAAGGDALVISDATIASDLAPVGRVITFTGRTVDDAPIPAGDYQATVEIAARGGTVTYRRGGLLVHWQP